MRRVVSAASVLLTLAVLGVVLISATILDLRPPRVGGVALQPPAGTGERALTRSAITVDFDELVDRQSVERRFRIVPVVAGAFTWDGLTATFWPLQSLPPATHFSITIDPGFTDLAGNAAPVGLEAWSFTTGE